ncbi:MAG: SLBB domain-containing protein, partial [Armatimonadota bacterium]
MAKAPQAIFESLLRFGASLFASIDARPTDTKPAPKADVRPDTPKPLTGDTQPVPAQVQPASNMPVPPNYVVGPGDTLSLSVWARDIEQVKQTLTVSPEGFIIFPSLGRLTVAGQTLEQLRQSLTQSYTRYFINPAVTLVVSEQRVVDVFVSGDAVRPGKYSLAGMATVLSALYAAGGPSDIGSFRKIRLNRVGQPSVEIDLYDYLLTGSRDKDVVLAPGDSLFIPTLRGEVGLTGELRRPGRYEIKDQITLAQAVELAGGFKPSAYLPVVHLWRANARSRWELTTVNCGDKAGPDLQQPLHDGDLLIVKSILNTGENTVQLMGAVKRPGYYPCLPDSTVSSLLRSAEGLLWNAHMGTGVLRRMDHDRHYQLITFNVQEQMYSKTPLSIALEPKDEVEILSQDAVEPPPTVRIEGAVAHPGTYQWAGKMCVSQLVLLAGSLLPEAYVDRADLLRLTPDQRYEVLNVNLKAALAGDVDKDFALQRGDILKVSLIADALPLSRVTIGGFVRNAAPYQRREGMKVSDLIFVAGGLKPGAGPQVEVTPGRFEGQPQVIALRLTGTPDNYKIEPDMVLGDGDNVSIKGRGEFSEQADIVFLQGRVQSPGSFTIKRTKTEGYSVRDVLRESGGLLEDANPNGIVVYRKREVSVGAAQAEDLTRILQSVNRESNQPIQVDQPTQTAAYGNAVAQGLTALVSANSTAIVLPPRPVRPEDWVTAIPVSGASLLASGGPGGDVQLEPGDTVVVPKRLHTVTILGAVPRSGAV